MSRVIRAANSTKPKIIDTFTSISFYVEQLLNVAIWLQIYLRLITTNIYCTIVYD